MHVGKYTKKFNCDIMSAVSENGELLLIQNAFYTFVWLNKDLPLYTMTAEAADCPRKLITFKMSAQFELLRLEINYSNDKHISPRVIHWLTMVC